MAAAIVNQTIAGRKSLTISSAIRTAPQQLALYSWQSPVCSSVPIASKPGSSNHHGGIAIDIGGVEREWWKQKLEVLAALFTYAAPIISDASLCACNRLTAAGSGWEKRIRPI